MHTVLIPTKRKRAILVSPLESRKPVLSGLEELPKDHRLSLQDPKAMLLPANQAAVQERAPLLARLVKPRPPRPQECDWASRWPCGLSFQPESQGDRIYWAQGVRSGPGGVPKALLSWKERDRERFEDTMELALKTEDGAASQGMRAASRSQKRPGNKLSPRTAGGMQTDLPTP